MNKNDVTPQMWIDELLSGRTKRGVGQMELADGSQCCLGVLATMCEIDFLPGRGWLAGKEVKGYPDWFHCNDDGVADTHQSALAEFNDKHETIYGVWDPKGPVVEYIREHFVGGPEETNDETK